MRFVEDSLHIREIQRKIGVYTFVTQDLDSIPEVRKKQSQKQLFFYWEDFNGLAHIFLAQPLTMFHTLIWSLGVPFTHHLKQLIIYP